MFLSRRNEPALASLSAPGRAKTVNKVIAFRLEESYE